MHNDPASDRHVIPMSAFVDGAGGTGHMTTAERNGGFHVRGTCTEATANLRPEQKIERKVRRFIFVT